MNRADRRRTEKEHIRQIEAGIDPAEGSADLVAALTREIARRVELAKRISSVDPIFSFIFASMDRSIRKATEIKLACSKGCDHCCYTWVAANTGETIFFAKRFPSQPRETLLRRVAEEMDRVANLSFDEREKISLPCPALVDSRCSNYLARPNVCRTAASADEATCKRAYRDLTGENIPMPMAITIGVRSMYVVPLVAALQHAGISDRAYEFTNSLARILPNIRAVEKAWLGGEEVLKDVPIDPRPRDLELAVQQIRALAFG